MTQLSFSRQRIRTGRGMLALSLLVILSTLLVACGGSSPGSSGPKNTTLTMLANAGGDYPQNFNPYSGSVISGTQGLIYETLLYYNRLNGDVKPWLASSYQLASDAKSITFHLRNDVKWSDGVPFTSDDVVFSVNLLIKNTALDLNGITSFIKDVSASDTYTVTLTLNQAWNPIVWYMGGQTYIVSKHKWSTVTGDMTKYADPNPIGTGPYVVGSFTPQLVTLTKNPHYWQPGKPLVTKVKIPSYSSNTSAELALRNGEIDWTNLYIPDIEKTFVAVDKAHNHYWFPASDVVMLYLNLTKYPFNLLPVRKAISMALNRDQLFKVGEGGYEPAASPTALLPYNKDYVAPEYANATFVQDPAGAMKQLESAGFHKGGDGIYADNKGKKLEFNLNVVSGYTDWITDTQIMASNLNNVGIKVHVNTIDFDPYFNALQNGDYDMAMLWTNPGPTPYYIYNGLLASSNSAPIGQSAASNYERWQDPATDSLLNDYASSTDLNVQKQAIYGLQKIMVEKLPSIPLTNEPYWYQYRTNKFTGWPDEQHQYAAPGTAVYPDIEYVLLNLQPV